MYALRRSRRERSAATRLSASLWAWSAGHDLSIRFPNSDPEIHHRCCHVRDLRGEPGEAADDLGADLTDGGPRGRVLTEIGPDRELRYLAASSRYRDRYRSTALAGRTPLNTMRIQRRRATNEEARGVDVPPLPLARYEAYSLRSRRPQTARESRLAYRPPMSHVIPSHVLPISDTFSVVRDLELAVELLADLSAQPFEDRRPPRSSSAPPRSTPASPARAAQTPSRTRYRRRS